MNPMQKYGQEMRDWARNGGAQRGLPMPQPPLQGVNQRTDGLRPGINAGGNFVMNTGSGNASGVSLGNMNIPNRPGNMNFGGNTVINTGSGNASGVCGGDFNLGYGAPQLPQNQEDQEDQVPFNIDCGGNTVINDGDGDVCAIGNINFHTQKGTTANVNVDNNKVYNRGNGSAVGGVKEMNVTGEGKTNLSAQNNEVNNYGKNNASLTGAIGTLNAADGVNMDVTTGNNRVNNYGNSNEFAASSDDEAMIVEESSEESSEEDYEGIGGGTMINYKDKSTKNINNYGNNSTFNMAPTFNNYQGTKAQVLAPVTDTPADMSDLASSFSDMDLDETIDLVNTTYSKEMRAKKDIHLSEVICEKEVITYEGILVAKGSLLNKKAQAPLGNIDLDNSTCRAEVVARINLITKNNTRLEGLTTAGMDMSLNETTSSFAVKAERNLGATDCHLHESVIAEKGKIDLYRTTCYGKVAALEGDIETHKGTVFESESTVTAFNGNIRLDQTDAKGKISAPKGKIEATNCKQLNSLTADVVDIQNSTKDGKYVGEVICKSPDKSTFLNATIGVLTIPGDPNRSTTIILDGTSVDIFESKLPIKVVLKNGAKIGERVGNPKYYTFYKG